MGNDRKNEFLIDCGFILQLGSLFDLHFQHILNHRIGLWLYSKFDMILDYLVMRWGWTWLQQPEDVWRKSILMLLRRLTNLKKE